MDVKMGDFLPQPVVDRQLVVILDSELPGDHFGGIKTQLERFGRCSLEIDVRLLGDNQQMDRSLRTVVGNDDYLAGLVEYPGWQFTPDYACEDGGHERNIQTSIQLATARLRIRKSFVSLGVAPATVHGIENGRFR